MFNFVLILLEQHCTGKKPYAMCFKKLQTTLYQKNLVQCCVNTVGTTLGRPESYAMLSEGFQTILHEEKFCLMLS